MFRKPLGIALAILLLPLSASAATNFKVTRTQGVAPLTAVEDEGGCGIEAATVARI